MADRELEDGTLTRRAVLAGGAALGFAIATAQARAAVPGGAEAAGPTGGPEGGPIATDGRRIFVLSNDLVSEGCVAAALSPRDGRVLWRTSIPAPTFAAPALGAGRLHVAGSDGTLRVLDGQSGRIVARASLGGASSAAPAIAAGRLVVGTGAAPFIPGDALVCLG